MMPVEVSPPPAVQLGVQQPKVHPLDSCLFSALRTSNGLLGTYPHGCLAGFGMKKRPLPTPSEAYPHNCWEIALCEMTAEPRRGTVA